MVAIMAASHWEQGEIRVQVADLQSKATVSASMGSVIQLEGNKKRIFFDLLSRAPFQMRICCADTENLTEYFNPLTGESGFLQLNIEGLPQGASCCQAQVLRLADGRFRMYFWFHGTINEKRAVRYLIAESTDGLNFKCLDLETAAIYHPADSALDLSADFEGLVTINKGGSSQEKRKNDQKLRLMSNDATFVNPTEQGFEMYSVYLAKNSEDSGHYVLRDNAPTIRRIIHRRISEDGLAWSDPEIVLWPDEKDPWDLQFYCLASHELGQSRMGLVSYYSVAEQAMDLEFAFSRDGLRWERPLRGGWVRRELESGYGTMLLPSRGLFTDGREKAFVFAGFNYRHDEAAELKFRRGVICKGTFHEDRLIGVASLPKGQSQLLTNPFVLTQEKLFLLGDLEGRVTASLKNLHGEEIKGASHLNSALEEIEPGKFQLSWEGVDLAERRFVDVYRLEVAFEKSQLFGFEA